MPTQDQANQRPLVVGYFGQINRWKGIDLIVEGFLLAQQQHAELQLQIHGGWPDTGDELLEALTQRLTQLQPQLVQCRGAYQPAELPQRLQAVDVVVMGSRWYENAPMVIDEANQLGRPVVAPSLGGMAEKIDHKRSGLLFEPGNAQALAHCLQRLASEPALLRQLQLLSATSGKRIKTSAERHERLYQALLSD